SRLGGKDARRQRVCEGRRLIQQLVRGALLGHSLGGGAGASFSHETVSSRNGKRLSFSRSQSATRGGRPGARVSVPAVRGSSKRVGPALPGLTTPRAPPRQRRGRGGGRTRGACGRHVCSA